MPKQVVIPEGFALVTMDRPVSSAEMLAEIEKAGMRPATAAELEGFLEAANAPDADEEPVESVAEVFPEPTVTSYGRLTVNRDLSIEDMVKTGEYTSSNSNLTSAHFPVEGTGMVDVEAVLLHFGRYVTSEDVIAKMQELGLSVGRPEHSLAFGAKHRDVHREFPIVALEPSWLDPDGGRQVAELWGNAWDRYADLVDFGDEWSGGRRFLAYRELPPKSLA